MSYLQLTNPEHAYLFGFLQGDGHLFQNKHKPGKGLLCVELAVVDRALLERFQAMFPFYSSVKERTRTTNFRQAHTSVVWSVSHQPFREELKALGLPSGRKSEHITMPTSEVSLPDYLRGLIDADGSLGLTGQGLPFLSLTTTSDAIAIAYSAWCEEITGEPLGTKRNRRDNVYNLTLLKEKAQQVVERLYYPGALALPRKQAKAQAVLGWVRPASFKRIVGRKPWTLEQDNIVLTQPTSEAMVLLGRGRNSVVIRRNRLLRKQKQLLITD